MNEEIKPELGVATTLPSPAIARLTRAAEQARMQPEDSFERAHIIAVAIRAVKADYPNKFVSEEDDHSR